MPKNLDYSPAFVGDDIDGGSAYIKESPMVLDKLNQGQLFKIEQKGRRFHLAYLGEKPMSLHVNNLEDAVEFRKFLKELDIKNKSCLNREDLSNQCLLERTKDNEVYRKKDMNSWFRGFIEPELYQGGLPQFLKGEKVPADTVRIIMDYMNLTMTRTSQL